MCQGVLLPQGCWELTFSSRLNSSLDTGELTLDLVKSLKLLERCRESWKQEQKCEGGDGKMGGGLLPVSPAPTPLHPLGCSAHPRVMPVLGRVFCSLPGAAMYHELPTTGMWSSWCLCSCLAQYSQGRGALVWSLALPCWEQPRAVP